jgi:hypothetical protein
MTVSEAGWIVGRRSIREIRNFKAGFGDSGIAITTIILIKTEERIQIEEKQIKEAEYLIEFGFS